MAPGARPETRCPTGGAVSARPRARRVCLLVSLLVNGRARPFPGCQGGTLAGCPSTANCTVEYLEQKIDHFNWASPLSGNISTYMQRYFVNQQWWRPGGPIFFYFGNEDDVELYVNHTGLMWESAADFGALLVFAEHRYYGQSLPFPRGTAGCMSWLTAEQAMADFAYLVERQQERYAAAGAARLPVVGFGGSYGGMLAAWFRMKYPQSVDGVIAASAPIWSFAGLSPPYDYNAFNLGVAYDASTAGGANDRCKRNLKAAWPRVIRAGETAAGRKLLARSFRTCAPVRPRGAAGQSDDPLAVVDWASGPWANMAMGNYPYPSSYLMHGKSVLPAWPVREACKHLDADFADDAALFEAVRRAAATQYNNSGSLECFDITRQPGRGSGMGARFGGRPRQPLGPASERAAQDCVGDWDYHWCTEMVQPFTQGTPGDMFFCPSGPPYAFQNCSQWDFEGEAARCEATWGVRPRMEWARLALAPKRLGGASNIVFSNGLQDPWHAGGVLANVSDSVLAVVIPNGAHHIDLMFSDPADAEYPDILAAREFERGQIRRWLSESQPRSLPVEVLV